ncbi:MAG: NUDIX domain-containing protein [Planctomycetota bacterium]
MTTPDPAIPSHPTAQTNPRDHAQPEVIARGLIIEAGKVLVCQNLAKGYSYLPGGHVDPGETAAAALAREFLEECGLGVEVKDPAVICELVTGPDDGSLHEYSMVFHVERRGSDEPCSPVESRENHIGFVWLDLAAVVDADLRPTPIKAWIASGGSVQGPAVPFVTGG